MDSSILNLPEELILKILTYSDIESQAILKFGESCQKFHDLVQDPILWKRRLQIQYPKIYNAIVLHGSEEWLEQYQYVHKLEITILKELKKMSPNLFWSKDLAFEDAAPFFAMCRERNISLYAVHSILVDVHTKSERVIESDYPTASPFSLTVQYYATHVIRFLMHVYFMMTWRTMTLTLKEISPERALNFYVNWIDTFQYVDYLEQKKLLDNLAEEVLKELAPDHPARGTPPQTRESWLQGGLADNQWAPEHNRAVHAAMRHVIYTKRATKTDYKLSPRSLNIAHVLKKKKAHPIAVAVLYEGVARRCGVKCQIISFPEHFFVEWRESYAQASPAFRLDLTTGQLQKKRTCPYATGAPSNQHRDYSPEALISRITEQFRTMLDNERNASLIIKVESLDEIVQRYVGNTEGRYYKKFKYLLNHEEITKMLTDDPSPDFHNLDDNYRRLMVDFAVTPLGNVTRYVRPKRTVYRNRRSSQVYFAVGMVCEHLVYNYTCVLIGWDTVCTASLEWQARMGVQQLMHKGHQPFYNVYATDGTTRYVAQENLNLVIGQRPKIIEDIIGKEFSHFNGTYYIPNVEKQKEYPDEQQVIAAYRRAPTLLSRGFSLF